MRMSTINGSPLRRYFTDPPEIQIRANDSLFARIAAEENLFKEIEITGLLSTTRAMDIFDVTVKG